MHRIIVLAMAPVHFSIFEHAKPQRSEEPKCLDFRFCDNEGLVTGPLALALALWLTIGWLISRQNFKKKNSTTSPKGLKSAFIRPLKFRQQKVLRRLLLLLFSGFMLDILLGFLALLDDDVTQTISRYS